MKNKVNKNINVKLGIFTVLFFTIIMVGHAQISLPNGSAQVQDAPSAPIDGLIGLAMLAGAVFGGKKLRGNKKE